MPKYGDSWPFCSLSASRASVTVSYATLQDERLCLLRESEPKVRRPRTPPHPETEGREVQPPAPRFAPAPRSQPQDAFRLIADPAPFIIWFVSPDGATLYNEAWKEFTGQEDDSKGSQTWITLVHPEERESAISAYRSAVRDGRPFSCQYRLRRADGEYRWVLGVGGPLADATGQSSGYIGYCLDITDRIRTEEALRRAEGQHRDIYENAVFGIFQTTPDGRFISANRALAEMFGYSDAEELMANVTDIGRQIHVEPERRAQFAHLLEEHGEVHDFESQAYSREGIIWISLTARAKRDETGRVQSFEGIVRDITNRKRVEQALAESEERFRLLSAASPIGIFVTDPAGRCTYCNPAAQRISGLSAQDAMGLGWLRRVPAEDRRRILKNWATGGAAQESQEVRFGRPDGSLRWVRLRSSPLLTPDGAMLGYVGTLEDVTEHKSSEDALRDSERQFRAVFEGARDALVIVDDEGRFLDMNPAACNLFGRAREELLGRTLAHYAIEADAAAASQPPLQEGAPEGELQVRRPDGSLRYLEYSATADFLPGRHLAVMRDVTERRKEDSEVRFLADATALLTSSLDYETTLAQVARLAVPYLADSCSVHVFSEGRMSHRASVAHVHPKKEDLMRRLHGNYPPRPGGPHPFARLIETAQPVLVEEVDYDVLDQIVEDDEHRRILKELDFASYIAVPLIARGRLFGALTFARERGQPHYSQQDVGLTEELARRAALAIDNARLFNESQRITEELRLANEAKDEFLGLVSHELRTPITSLYGGARILRSRFAQLDEESRDDLLADLEQESERLHRIVEDLLVLARMELGDTVSAEPVMVRQLVDRVAADFLKRHPNRRLKLQVPPGLRPVEAETTYLEQVLRNLLSNADKYSRADSAIEVRAREEDDTVAVSVLDRGAGISAEETELIFERFYRSGRTSQQARGVGIGLTVCKRLIETLGGRVWARPRKGGGLEVGFSLPASHEASR